jgi:FkbM family methyltransferase
MALNEEQINLVYEIVLGRRADESGLATYLHVSKQQGLNTLHSVAQLLYDSVEFQSRFGANRCNVFNRLREICHRGLTFTLPEEDFTFKELRYFGAYEPYVSDHLFPRLSPGDIFIDVGANAGLFSLPAAKLVAPTGKVFAFEASSRNANLLRKNALQNNIANVEVFPLGLSDKNGAVLSPVWHHSSDKVLLSENNRANVESDITDTTELVPVVMLDSFIDKHTRISVMKIDIEGFEYRMVSGAIDTIAKSTPKIYMEYCPALLLKGSGVPGPKLLDLMLSLGYRPTILHRNRTPEGLEGTREQIITRIETALQHHVQEGGTHLDLYWETK